MSADRPTLEGLRIDRTHAPASRGSFSKLLLFIAVFLVVAAALVWWLRRPKPIEVRTAAAREMAVGSQATLLNASGYVTARRLATVSSKVTGKIIEVLVDEGSQVQEGQILARVDASNSEASLHLAEAQLNSAKQALAETSANLELAEIDLRRQRELAEKNIVSPSDLDRAESNARALRGRRDRGLSEIGVAERQVDVWKQQLDDTIIRAPFTGIVTSKNAQPGEMISPMSSGGFTRTGVCTLVDMSSLEIEVDVNESYINRVEANQPVQATLDSYPDWRIPAHVIAIIPTADRQKATVKVRVGFEKLDPRILPDMGVKVAFQATASAAASSVVHTIAVPPSAVRLADGHDIVYVVHDGRAERRAVTVSAKNADQVLLSAGVSAGERIIIQAPDTLTDGAVLTETKP